MADEGQEGDRFGERGAVSSVPDLDGDGRDELLVGASADESIDGQKGAAYLFVGTDSVPELYTQLSPSESSTSSGFGGTVFAGDWDGDGTADLGILAGAADAAHAYFSDGKGDGPAFTEAVVQATSKGEVSYASHGSALFDMDGDGADELVVTDWREDRDEDTQGAVYVYAWDGTRFELAASLTTEPAVEDGYFGRSVTSAGDVDADGFQDLLVGSIVSADGRGSGARGSAYLLYGSASGVSMDSATFMSPTEIPKEVDQLSFAYEYVSGAGDLDGDGFEDIAVGANAGTQSYEDDGDTSPGLAYVYYGSSTGIDLGSETLLSPLDVDPKADPEGQAQQVSGVGDLDADGFDDLAVGAWGRVYLYWGGPDGVSASDAEIIESPEEGYGFFNPVAAGDLNGDGVDDLAVGGTTDDGRACVFIYHGQCDDQDGDGVCVLDDCDDTDPDDTSSPTSWYADDDGDGYGAGDPTESCDAPTGSVSVEGDCDDADASVHPGAEEVVADGVDQDCDGVDDPSQDTGGTDSRPLDSPSGDTGGGTGDTGGDGGKDCGCRSAGVAAPWLALLPLLWLRRRVNLA